jgi:hypothetical protein
MVHEHLPDQRLQLRDSDLHAAQCSGKCRSVALMPCQRALLLIRVWVAS